MVTGLECVNRLKAAMGGDVVLNPAAADENLRCEDVMARTLGR